MTLALKMNWRQTQPCKGKKQRGQSLLQSAGMQSPRASPHRCPAPKAPLCAAFFVCHASPNKHVRQHVQAAKVNCKGNMTIHSCEQGASDCYHSKLKCLGAQGVPPTILSADAPDDFARTAAAAAVQFLKCLAAHVDALTSKSLADLSPESATYAQRTLLQSVEREDALTHPADSAHHKAQVCCGS